MKGWSRFPSSGKPPLHRRAMRRGATCLVLTCHLDLSARLAENNSWGWRSRHHRAGGSDPMIRTVIGVIVASIVIYAWGFLYWGLGPYPTYIWKHAADGEGAGKPWCEHFPERGTYFVPAAPARCRPRSRGALSKGPVAMVHMLHPAGPPGFRSHDHGRGLRAQPGRDGADRRHVATKCRAASYFERVDWPRWSASLRRCLSTAATSSGGKFPGSGNSIRRSTTFRCGSSPGWFWPRSSAPRRRADGHDKHLARRLADGGVADYLATAARACAAFRRRSSTPSSRSSHCLVASPPP